MPKKFGSCSRSGPADKSVRSHPDAVTVFPMEEATAGAVVRPDPYDCGVIGPVLKYPGELVPGSVPEGNLLAALQCREVCGWEVLGSHQEGPFVV